MESSQSVQAKAATQMKIVQDEDGTLGLAAGSHSDDEGPQDETIQLQSQLFQVDLVDMEEIEVEEVTDELLLEFMDTIVKAEEQKGGEELIIDPTIAFTRYRVPE